MIRNISVIICAVIGILKFLLLRLRHDKILLIDFDFTIVSNHYDQINKDYIEMPLEVDKDILKIMTKNKEICKVIFTARGLRSKNYIYRNLAWRKYFNDVTYFGSTKVKCFVAKYIVAPLFKKIIWIDDLGDLNFETGEITKHPTPSTSTKIEFIRW